MLAAGRRRSGLCRLAAAGGGLANETAHSERGEGMEKRVRVKIREKRVSERKRKKEVRNRKR